MKNKDDLDLYIERRLEEWATWYSNDCHNLSYSRRNILARLKDDGGIVSEKTGQKQMMSNVEAEEIEKLYLFLFNQNKKKAEALRIHYHFPFNHEMKAVEFGYSKAQYYRYLSSAHDWLKGFFFARKKYFT